MRGWRKRLTVSGAKFLRAADADHILSEFPKSRTMALNLPVISTTDGKSVSAMLLSLGLVFSVATQLRLPGLPFGLGETLLLTWLLTTLVSTQNWRNPALAGVLSLTVVGVFMLGVGYFITTYPTGQSRPPSLHDTLAYAFCAVLAINYARLADRYENSLPFALLGAFLLSVTLALMLGVIAKKWSGMDVFYYHSRWQHLSNNPNQFALLVLPLPFLALHLILRQHEKSLLIPTIAYLLALALGLLSQSDALALAWICGGLVTALALLRNRPQTFTHIPAQPPPARHARHIAAMLILLMVASSTWQWRGVATAIITKLSQGTELSQRTERKDPYEVGLRIDLIYNSLAAIQFSPLTGLGPGAHSGFTKPFAGEEAHNTLLDWGTQTGLVGMAALAAYLVWLLWQVGRGRQYELTAMLLSLYCFSMFYHALRQPLFWIIPLLAWSLAVSDMRSRIAGCLRQPAVKG